MYKKFDEKLGFSLIELMLVIAIIGIISAVGIPMYQGYTLQAKQDQAVNNMQSIILAQTEYYRDRDSYYPCPVVATNTNDLDNQFFSGNGDLSDGAYDYVITGGCLTYSIQAIPK